MQEFFQLVEKCSGIYLASLCDFKNKGLSLSLTVSVVCLISIDFLKKTHFLNSKTSENMSSNIFQDSSDNILNISGNPLLNLEQEVKDQVEILNVQQKKYQEHQILLSFIEEFVKDESRPMQLRLKVKNVLLEHQIKCSKPAESEDDILGVTLNEELSDSEGMQLSICLEMMMKRKVKAVEEKLTNKITGSESLWKLSAEDSEILKLLTELNSQQELYASQQKRAVELLEKLKYGKLDIVPELIEHKIANIKLNYDLNLVKAEIANCKWQTDVFNETSSSLEAYKLLLKDMKEEETELQHEIERLEILKQKYADVSCPEYNDILKSYLQYKEALERKQLMKQVCM